MTKTGCQARQQSDQMVCPRCGLAWDVNDPDPPQCRKDEPKVKLSDLIKPLPLSSSTRKTTTR